MELCYWTWAVVSIEQLSELWLCYNFFSVLLTTLCLLKISRSSDGVYEQWFAYHK